jgi:hypothetical protein
MAGAATAVAAKLPAPAAFMNLRRLTEVIGDCPPKCRH